MLKHPYVGVISIFCLSTLSVHASQTTSDLEITIRVLEEDHHKSELVLPEISLPKHNEEHLPKISHEHPENDHHPDHPLAEMPEHVAEMPEHVTTPDHELPMHAEPEHPLTEKPPFPEMPVKPDHPLPDMPPITEHPGKIDPIIPMPEVPVKPDHPMPEKPIAHEPDPVKPVIEPLPEKPVVEPLPEKPLAEPLPEKHVIVQ